MCTHTTCDSIVKVNREVSNTQTFHTCYTQISDKAARFCFYLLFLLLTRFIGISRTTSYERMRFLHYLYKRRSCMIWFRQVYDRLLFIKWTLVNGIVSNLSIYQLICFALIALEMDSFLFYFLFLYIDHGQIIKRRIEVSMKQSWSSFKLTSIYCNNSRKKNFF